MTSPPNPKDLRERLHYDPDTGIFTWLVRKTTKVQIGDRAGSLSAQGYRQIMIDGVNYLEHRLAWFMSKGYWPVEVDHINRDKTDNRLINLRECTRTENALNRPSTGVYQDKRTGRWIAQITISGKGKHLGSFSTKEKAAEARAQAASKEYKEFYCEPQG